MSARVTARLPYSPGRRATALLGSAVRRMVDGGRVDGVRAGRILMGAEGGFALGVAPWLGLNSAAYDALLSVSTVMATLLLASFTVPWRRLPPPATSAFAILAILALGVLGLLSPVSFTPFGSFITLSFVYLGVTQTARTAFVIAPLAAATLVVNYGNVSGPVLIRAVAATSVWLLTAWSLTALMSSNAAAAELLRRAASVDQLTGIPNRRDLDARLTALAVGDTVLVLDLDHFKRINDTAGHAAGDDVLRRFGGMLRRELRGADYCARLGGEEFVIIVPADDIDNGHRVLIDRLRTRWSRLQPGVTFSSGAARNHLGRTPQETLHLADQALYAAKTAGRNTDRDTFNDHLSAGHPFANRRFTDHTTSERQPDNDPASLSPTVATAPSPQPVT